MHDKIFDQNFLKDPFKEENFVYKDLPDADEDADTNGAAKEENPAFFKIHVDVTHTGGHPQEPPKQQEPKYEKRTIKSVLIDAWRQIAASTIILVIGFFLLNWSAYSQIIQNRWQQFRGVESPLSELTEIETTSSTTGSLQASADPQIQQKQIPPLELDISPSDNRIIIPRIDQNIPIVRVSSESLIKRDWTALEKEMQEALKDGVVHYPGTSLPGQTGNVVITGHSSYFPWDPGRFKDVFALLHDVVVGDRIVIYYDQDKYLYEISEIDVVLPEDIDVLKQTPDDQVTLITCTPVGTNLKRLIVKAKPVAINGKLIEQEATKVSR